MRALSVIVVAGCWTTPVVQAPAPRPDDHELVMTNESFGTLDASSPGTLAFVREHFPDFDVRPRREDAALEYAAFAGSDELFHVVANDDLSIFNIQATSAKITSRVHDWRVGAAFHDAQLITKCECWGDKPTCFHRGDHVAVNFDRPCDGVVGATDRRDLAALDGLVTRELIWSPSGFGDNSETDGVDDVRVVEPIDGSDDDDGF
ncbi:MAG TPA: hypothetical protein VGG28_01250 [Kofleriaceae bacterium]|jgi:hypothetical protein